MENLGIFLRNNVVNSTECQHWQESIAYYILLERSHCQLSHKQEISAIRIVRKLQFC